MLRAMFIVFTLLTMFLAVPQTGAAEEPWGLETPVTMEDIERVVDAPMASLTQKPVQADRLLLDLGREHNRNILRALFEAHLSGDVLAEGACNGISVEQARTTPHYAFSSMNAILCKREASSDAMTHLLLSFDDKDAAVASIFTRKDGAYDKGCCVKPDPAVLATLKQGLAGLGADTWQLDSPVTMEEVDHIIRAPQAYLARKPAEGDRWLMDLQREENRTTLQALFEAFLSGDVVSEGACGGRSVEQARAASTYEFSALNAIPCIRDAPPTAVSQILLSFEPDTDAPCISIFPKRFRLYDKAFCAKPAPDILTRLKQGLAGTDTDKRLLDLPVTMEKVQWILTNHNVLLRRGTAQGDWSNIDVTSAYGAEVLQALLTATLRFSVKYRYQLDSGIAQSTEAGWHYRARIEPPIPWQPDTFRTIASILLQVVEPSAANTGAFLYVNEGVYSTPLPLPDILYFREPGE